MGPADADNSNDADLRPTLALPAPAPAPLPAKSYSKTAPGSWLGPLKIKIDKTSSIMQLQPKRHPSDRVPTIVLDLKHGTIQTLHNAPWLPDETPVVFGVIGLVKLSGGSLLAVITKAKRVSCVEDAIYHITETQLITHEATRSSTSDLRYAALLQEALDAKDGGGGHMYFSHRSHVTLSSQQQARVLQQQGQGQGSSPSKAAGGKKGPAKAPPSVWAQADQRFVWNAALMKPLLDAGLDAFATPIMVGYMGQVPDIHLTSLSGRQQMDMHVTLISRIDCHRAGTLAWRSGLDAQGTCAHLVETELRVQLRTSSHTPLPPPPHQQPQQQQEQEQQENEAAPLLQDVTSAPSTSPGPAAQGAGGDTTPPTNSTTHSYVQLRGSLPLLWSSPPNLELTPRVHTCADVAQQQAALTAHLTDLRSRYKAISLLQVPSRSVSGLVTTLATLYATQRHRKGGRTKPSSAAAGASSVSASGGDDGPEGSTDSTAHQQPQPGLAAATSGVIDVQQLRAVDTTFEQLLAVAGACGGLYLVRGGADGGTGGDGAGGDGTGSAGGAAAVAAVAGSQYVLGCGLDEVLAGGGGDVAGVLVGLPGPRRRLLAAVQELLAGKHGSFCQVGAGSRPQLQCGVLRMSCPGSVDLTNLLQAELGFAWLEGILHRSDLLSEGQPLRQALPDLHAALCTLWANQGGILADQMAGGSCSSSGAIRAGGEALGWMARLGWLINSLQRYYVHNFSECERQDLVDVATGAHKIDLGVKPPGRRAGTYTWLQLAAVCAGWSLFQVLLAVLSDQPSDLATIAYYIVLPSCLCAALLYWVYLIRDTYTPKPLLEPRLTQTWSASSS